MKSEDSSEKSSSAEKQAEESWGVRGVGRRWQMRFFRDLIRFFGRRPAYHIMYIAVFWYVLTIPEIRKRAGHYLNRRFPEHTGGLRRFFDTYRLVCNFGRMMIDRFAFAAFGRKELEVTSDNIEELKKVLDNKRGAVLINAHLGCWQVAMSILDFLQIPVSVVMIPPGDFESGSADLERDLPFQTIDPRRGFEGVLEMMQALQRGEILGMMGDRVFGARESTVTTNFLGEPIRLPFAPYRLAGAAGVPIIVLFSYKSDYRRYVIKVARIIEVERGKTASPTGCETYARQFAETLEEFVWEHPWQFFNFYDLWSDVTAKTAAD